MIFSVPLENWPHCSATAEDRAGHEQPSRLRDDGLARGVPRCRCTATRDGRTFPPSYSRLPFAIRSIQLDRYHHDRQTRRRVGEASLPSTRRNRPRVRRRRRDSTTGRNNARRATRCAVDSGRWLRSQPSYRSSSNDVCSTDLRRHGDAGGRSLRRF